MPCNHRHVLITGTSSGIGRATMHAAAEAGWHVFAGDRVEGERQTQEAGRGLISPVHLDVTSDADITSAMAFITDHVGDAGLDGLANIAGIGIAGPLEILPMTELRRSFDVDFFGQFALTQAALPLLRTAKGRIIFIGSIIDRMTIPFMGALGASKSAIAALADTWRLELSPWGIHVTLVEPGFIVTGADGATKAQIDRTVANLTPEQESLYGEMFREMTERGYKAQTSGSSPEGVAAVILDALTSKHPDDHVLTGSKSHIVGVMAKLPQPVQDHLKRELFGLPGPDSR
jgi:NAD(P)-dependent dehydrogenase (short-subunit alcohol dehydrogenase family)